MKKLGIILGLLSIVVIGVVLFFYDMGIDNKEMALREQFKGQEKVCKTSHDLMYKVITQDAQVTDKYSEDFEKIFSKIAGGMLSDDAMLQLISGFNPQLSTDMYKELMTTIKTERAKFKRAQDICIDVSRRYTTYIKTKPQTWFINDEILAGKDLFDRRFTKEEIKNTKPQMETEESWRILSYKPVTSSATEDVFESGVDDNVELFTKTETKKTENSSKKTKLTESEKLKHEKEMKEYLKEHPEVVLAVGNQTKVK